MFPEVFLSSVSLLRNCVEFKLSRVSASTLFKPEPSPSNEPENEPELIIIEYVELSPFSNSILPLLYEEVTNNEPVFIGLSAEPVFTVILKVLLSPFVKVISFKLTEAVVNKEPVLTGVKEPVSIVTVSVVPSPWLKVIVLRLTEEDM